MHGLPRRKKKSVDMMNILQFIILAGAALFFLIYSYVENITILQIILWVAIGAVSISFTSGQLIRYLTGRGYAIAMVFNELFFLLVALPVAVLTASYLPIIILSFFKIDVIILRIIFWGTLIILEISSITYSITKTLSSKKMSLREYIKYLFDFEKRAEEREIFLKRRNQIDSFYTGLYRIEDNVQQKRSKRADGFEEFDWKGRLEMVTGKSKKELDSEMTSDERKEEAEE